jgi:hypothetical protein
MTHLFLYVVVAPSRSAVRSHDDGQVGRAKAFAQEAFPGVFPSRPEWADDRFVLFAVEDPDGRRAHQLYVHRSGLIELMWALQTEVPPDEPEYSRNLRQRSPGAPTPSYQLQEECAAGSRASTGGSSSRSRCRGTPGRGIGLASGSRGQGRRGRRIAGPRPRVMATVHRN